MVGEEIRFNGVNNTNFYSNGMTPQRMQQQTNPTEIGDLLRHPVKLEDIIPSLGSPKPPTEKQLAAREQLDTKV